MSDHYTGFQMLQKQEAQQRQQQQQTPDNNDNRGNWAYITDFVVDDIKLYVAPFKAIANEFVRQLKR